MNPSDVRHIAAMVAERTGVPVEMILGPRRVASVVVARHAFWMLLSKSHPRQTLPSIAAELGVHHTTLFHAIGILTCRAPTTIDESVSIYNELLPRVRIELPALFRATSEDCRDLKSIAFHALDISPHDAGMAAAE